MSTPSPGAGAILIAAFQALRPKQWTKNVLLFAALIFSLHFLDGEGHLALQTLGKAGAGFVAFCFLSSSGYILNDARDVESDRKHPTKKNRPIAAGRLPLGVAYGLMALVFALGVSVAYWVGPMFLAVAILYYITTLSYSLYWKNIVILDVMMLSSGFVWRAIAGAVAIDVYPSVWLLACTAFFALFLGFNKRRGELMLLEDRARTTRKILQEYSPELVQELQAVTSSGTIISYALYTALGSPTPWLMLTMPFVLYGVFRYMYLVRAKNEGGAPDETLYKDKPILATCLLYGLTVVMILLMAPINSKVEPL
jgi:4-hydroxybenzoate polyprenyltransferase